MTIHGFLGALIFMGLGLIELAVLSRTLYPALRWRYEKAKLTQEQGIRPQSVMLLLRIQSLIVMPVLGYVLGQSMSS